MRLAARLEIEDHSQAFASIVEGHCSSELRRQAGNVQEGGSAIRAADSGLSAR